VGEQSPDNNQEATAMEPEAIDYVSKILSVAGKQMVNPYKVQLELNGKIRI
jgi:hypothetical protein